MKVLLVFMFLCSPIITQGQDSAIKTVPKQMSLEAGYRRISGSELTNQASNGYSVMFDYAWQLSGLTGGKASYISVPLGYTQMRADSDTSRNVRVISYGWTVRHELRPQSKSWVPFLGYALMLNNYAEKGIAGHQFAHQTRFSLGLNHYSNSSFTPYVELDYSMTYYPQWGVKGSNSYKFMELKIGARFMHKKS